MCKQIYNQTGMALAGTKFLAVYDNNYFLNMKLTPLCHGKFPQFLISEGEFQAHQVKIV